MKKQTKTYRMFNILALIFIIETDTEEHSSLRSFSLQLHFFIFSLLVFEIAIYLYNEIFTEKNFPNMSLPLRCCQEIRCANSFLTHCMF